MCIRGNKAYAARDYREAKGWYTAAIDAGGADHVLYTNRSATYAALKCWRASLADAEKVTDASERLEELYTGCQHTELQNNLSGCTAPQWCSWLLRVQPHN